MHRRGSHPEPPAMLLSRVPASLTGPVLHAIIGLLDPKERPVPAKKKSRSKPKTRPTPRPKPASAMEDFGAKVGRTIGEAANRMERESERLVSYINSEVVPAIRGESTGALRTAAEKLHQFADYLDDKKRKK